MRYFNRLLFSFSVCLFIACNAEQKQEQPPQTIIDQAELNKKIVEANKMYIKRESDEIDQYIKLRGWEMITTGTGLRYMIIQKGKGKPSLPDTEATIKYAVSLLDGTPCYSSDKLGVRTFLVEKDNIESGLHEGIQYLHEGDKALFILPSHIAHGLLGDEDKIPSHATVVYELELISVH
jgi:FKBP-type peptidyl-prolyl cis-trans isomerase FkpA